jgi:hypothetical protein
MNICILILPGKTQFKVVDSLMILNEKHIFTLIEDEDDYLDGIKKVKFIAQ